MMFNPEGEWSCEFNEQFINGRLVTMIIQTKPHSFDYELHSTFNF